MKRILLLATGGTIAAAMSPRGLAPARSPEELLAFFRYDPARFQITGERLFDMDSSNIQPEEWLAMARKIEERYGSYDGFVITHGTDTLAYTASALSYILRGLDKSVVITGSQIPMGMDMGDGETNLATALAAVEAGIAGVSVAFNRRVIRGTRAVKVSTMNFDAFRSINAEYLAQGYADGMHVWGGAAKLPPAEGPFRVAAGLCTRVFLLKMIPGTHPDVLEQLPALRYRGVVVEAFGAGGIHYLHRDMLAALERLIHAGMAVVVCSQCLYDRSDLTMYEVGRRLLDIGAVPALDMTTEAAVTKLMWVLGQTEDPAEAKAMFARNIAGELSAEPRAEFALVQ